MISNKKDKLLKDIEKIYNSFGFDGYKKRVVYKNKNFYLYYFSFSGKWGISKSNKEYFLIDEILLNKDIKKYSSCKCMFNYIKKKGK